MNNPYKNLSNVRKEVFPTKSYPSYALFEKDAVEHLEWLLKRVSDVAKRPSYDVFNLRDRRVEYDLELLTRSDEKKQWLYVTTEGGKITNINYGFFADRMPFKAQFFGQDRKMMIKWLTPYFF